MTSWLARRNGCSWRDGSARTDGPCGNCRINRPHRPTRFDRQHGRGRTSRSSRRNGQPRSAGNPRTYGSGRRQWSEWHGSSGLYSAHHFSGAKSGRSCVNRDQPSRC